MHLQRPPSSFTTSTSAKPDVAWSSFLMVYSIPFILVLTVACIIKWRPMREFPNLRSFFSWYCSCSPKKVIQELEQPDRTHMIMSIDAQSLASMSSVIDSPLLVRRNEEESRKFESTAIP
ncbi:uncharacterized protein CELE_C54G4.5 [Caenorhabditis elegans]|uniref:Transmembrane protein n=1 Tax=Caenorhabditis elegans TaxID=6239 RepID=Q18850_CAEEL|nr:Transmembrane protein [Caenorhabditis elegans]CAA99817.2 Transmembrane protein [Caenorhabditis elegans]|eukprot:NP_492200.1 Uncharacterized protein CELE_C54G4.5 [Caenorhabditis elegans]